MPHPRGLTLLPHHGIMPLPHTMIPPPPRSNAPFPLSNALPPSSSALPPWYTALLHSKTRPHPRRPKTYSSPRNRVLNGAVRPSRARARTDDIVLSRPVISWICPTSKTEGPGRRTLCRPSVPAVFRRHLPSSTTPGRLTKAPAVPCLKLSHIVGLVVLHNGGRPASSRTRTDYIVPYRLVGGS